MSHAIEIVETKELSDELVSYKLRCCGDPTTDACHTISVLHEPTKEDPRTHDEVLEEMKVKHAAKHEAKVAWRKKMQKKGIKASEA